MDVSDSKVDPLFQIDDSSLLFDLVDLRKAEKQADDALTVIKAMRYLSLSCDVYNSLDNASSLVSKISESHQKDLKLFRKRLASGEEDRARRVLSGSFEMLYCSLQLLEHGRIEDFEDCHSFRKVILDIPYGIGVEAYQQVLNTLRDQFKKLENSQT
jgi:hypothetical protein